MNFQSLAHTLLLAIPYSQVHQIPVPLPQKARSTWVPPRPGLNSGNISQIRSKIDQNMLLFVSLTLMALESSHASNMNYKPLLSSFRKPNPKDFTIICSSEPPDSHTNSKTWSSLHKHSMLTCITQSRAHGQHFNACQCPTNHGHLHLVSNLKQTKLSSNVSPSKKEVKKKSKTYSHSKFNSTSKSQKCRQN